MHDKLAISKHLSEVLHDWQASRNAFPENTHPDSHWPIPFFGNPASAIVATIGVNPSSAEFDPERDWSTITNAADWKKRLKNYFNQRTPPHEWFNPWRVGLALLDLDYQKGTAAHFDVSYRPTLAPFKNPRTRPAEFRRMVERDVPWFFKLLLLCPKLKVLLTFGPIVGEDRQPESLFAFLFAAAPHHGFRVFQDETGWKLWHEPTEKVFLVHDADTLGEKCVTCRVVKNLYAHRDELLRCLK